MSKKKLSFSKWVKENYEFHGDYYTSKKELSDGVAYTDLSHFTQKQIEHYFIIYSHSD